MSGSSLVLAPSFLEQADRLSKEAKAKLVKCLRFLSSDTSHPGLRTKPLKGTRKTLYECRVDRSTRLVYDRNGGSLRCWCVGPHDETLRRAASDDLQVDDIDLVPILDSDLAVEEYMDAGETDVTFTAYSLDVLAHRWSTV